MKTEDMTHDEAIAEIEAVIMEFEDFKVTPAGAEWAKRPIIVKRHAAFVHALEQLHRIKGLEK